MQVHLVEGSGIFGGAMQHGDAFARQALRLDLSFTLPEATRGATSLI